MHNWLEWSSVRLLVHISCLPSGEKTGSTSAAGLSVIRVIGPGTMLAVGSSLVLHQPQVVVGPGLGIGVVGAGPDDVRLGRMPVGGPVHAHVVGQRHVVLAVDADGVDLQEAFLLAVAAKDHPLAVGRDERSAVVAGRVGQLPHVGAVGVHHVQVGIAVAVAAKGDLLAVGRIGAFGVVALGVGELLQVLAVEIGLEDVRVGIEVPLVAAALAGALVFGLLLALLLLGLRQLGVEMARGENQLLAVGREVAARRAAAAGADQLRLAAGQRLLVDLVEGIVLAARPGR